MTGRILCLNAGSSSLKFALFACTETRYDAIASGTVGGIGTSQTSLRIDREDGTTWEPPIEAADHPAAFQQVAIELGRSPDQTIDAIGHRVVHGGSRFHGPVQIDSTIMNQLRELVPFAPLHQPVQVNLIEVAREQFPDVPHVACFDTSIHHTLPEIAARFPLPRWVWDEGVRRYGFHGLSYESVLETHSEFRQGKSIIAHLGNGASAAAFQDGISVETTMGFTPTGGLMMGTRCGDLDPGVLLHLMRQRNMGADDLDRLVNSESGLKGVSGTTSDVRSLLDARNDPDARMAIDMFCYHAARQLAGLASSLKGVDRLAFTGGIGEHAAEIRASICERLSFLGLTVDEDRNLTNAPVISHAESRCTVHVVPTNEEQIIARHTWNILANIDASPGKSHFPPTP